MSHEELIQKTRIAEIEHHYWYLLNAFLSDNDPQGRNRGYLAVRTPQGHFIAVRALTHNAYHPSRSGDPSPPDNARIIERSDVEKYRGDHQVYQPIHPETTLADIETAKYAWDDGTYWHFVPGSPEAQIDLAAQLRSFTFDAFAEPIARATLKTAMAGNTAAREAAGDKARALIAFAKAAGQTAYDAVLVELMGHFEANPHLSHRRDRAVSAIAATLKDWKARALTDTAVAADRRLVTTDAGVVVNALSSTHVIKTKSQKAAEDKAAADTAAAESEQGD